MRKIKFRVWDKKSDSMRDHGWLYAAQVCYDALFDERKDLIIMQFTGLKDIKGTDIYDSDVLKDSRGTLWIVSWNDDHACFQMATSNGVVSEIIDNLNMQVTGNIYQS